MVNLDDMNNYDAILEKLRDPEGGLLFVCELVESAKDEGEIARIAAGPLEDFLDFHGEAIEEGLTNAVRKFPKMRKAITGVWASEGSRARKVLDVILKKFDLKYGSL
jgi:hypothetical protein